MSVCVCLMPLMIAPLDFIDGKSTGRSLKRLVAVILLCRKYNLSSSFQATKAQLSKVFSAMLAIHSNKPGMVKSLSIIFLPFM